MTNKKYTTVTEFDVSNFESLLRLDVVVSDLGAKDIVSAGNGAGQPTPAEDTAFDKCFKEKGMLMCLCSRVASGRVVRSPGLQRRGFAADDNLQPWKARLLFSLALTKTTNADEIQRMFDTY